MTIYIIDISYCHDTAEAGHVIAEIVAGHVPPGGEIVQSDDPEVGAVFQWPAPPTERDAQLTTDH